MYCAEAPYLNGVMMRQQARKCVLAEEFVVSESEKDPISSQDSNHTASCLTWAGPGCLVSQFLRVLSGK